MALNGTANEDFGNGRSRRAPISTYHIRLISTAAGVVDDTGGARTLIVHISGELISIAIVPDTGGTQPTDLWDLTMWTPEGVQIFADTGLSNATTTVKVPETDATSHRTLAVNGKLQFQAANMGDSKGAKLYIAVK